MTTVTVYQTPTEDSKLVAGKPEDYVPTEDISLPDTQMILGYPAKDIVRQIYKLSAQSEKGE